MDTNIATGNPNNLEYASLISNWESTSQSVSRPTIFDILAQENMNALFKSAFDHLFKWATSHCRSLARFRRFGDEVYLMIHSSVEFFYLKAYSGLFSEYFYGMKREPAIKGSFRQVLTALFSIIVPYLKSKLDTCFEELEKNIEGQQSEDEGVTFSRNKVKYVMRVVKRLLLKYYPYFHIIWTLTFWYYRINYMIKKSDFPSPIMRVLGQKPVYDQRQKEAEAFSLASLRHNFLKTVLYLSNNIFTTCLYFLQFIRWYQEYMENHSQLETSSREIGSALAEILTGRRSHRDKNAADKYIDDDMLVPPPRLPDKLLKGKQYKILTERSGMCPLCSRTRTNECVLTVSGFVFCYPCIFRFVRENRCCPITRYPCSSKSIVRLYANYD